MGFFEFIYYLGYVVKTSCDVARQKKLPVSVISIGNITSGGTGKTPATIAMANEAVRRGLNPCILTRGYGGNLKSTCVVNPGMNAWDVGDEPLLMASKMGEVPVVRDPDRHRGGIYALEGLEPRPDVFFLDDGFQHRKLHRDVDILLINARNPFDNGRLLPMGLLREPLGQMKRADFIVITKSDEKDKGELIKQIRSNNSAAPVFRAEHMPAYVQASSGERFPVDWLAGRKVMAFCGIAEPGYFTDILRQKGAQVVGYREYRDHFSYGRKHLYMILQEAKKCGAEWLITTEKDIMRLKEFDLPDNLLSLGIEFEIERDFHEQLFQKVFA
jgi:tetraacyldisaccharide 4'-kinase